MGFKINKQHLITVALIYIVAVLGYSAYAQTIQAESFRNPARTSTISLPSVTGTDQVLTVSATQTVRNKDFDGGTASNSNRFTLPKNTTTNLNALTRKQGTVFYDTDTNKIKIDTGSTLEEVTTTAVVSSPTTARITSGTNATLTLPAGVVWMRVRLVGGGGGGLGSNGNSAVDLSTTSLTPGGTSYFMGSVSGTIMSAGGGGTAGGGTFLVLGGTGGVGAVSETSTVRRVSTYPGQTGGHGIVMRSATDIWAGAAPAFGGGTCIAPANTSGGYGQPGVAGTANTGQGGGGAGMANVATSGRTGGGGGGGGCAEAIIDNPSSLGTITYTIGSGGSGATGDAYSGGPGAAGELFLEYHYAK